MARKQQKRCHRCNHVYSFHRNGRSRCFVTNCVCAEWDDSE